jgi:hypothetical protein
MTPVSEIQKLAGIYRLRAMISMLIIEGRGGGAG